MRTDWLATAFWMSIAFAGYVALGIPAWREISLFAVVGAATGYGWWRHRQRTKFWIFFSVTCALAATLALLVAGGSVVGTAFTPADSVGQREIACGSVVNPLLSDQLHVTYVETGEPVVELEPLPRSELVRVCGNELRHRTSNAIVLTVVGLLLSARAVGHLLPRRNPIPTPDCLSRMT